MAYTYDLYQILGLSKTAKAADIKAAYRTLAMKYHPDTNSDPDAQRKFIAIKSAYETLHNPIKRKVYDLQQQTGQVFVKPPVKKKKSTDSQSLDPEEIRRRYWASPAGQKRQKELQQEKTVYNIFRSFLIILSIPMAVFLLLILYDSEVHTKIPKQSYQLLKKEKSGSNYYYYHYQIGNHTYKLSSDYADCMGGFGEVKIYKGKIFGIVTMVELAEPCYEDDEGRFDPNTSLFGDFKFLVYGLMFFFFVLWFRMKNDPMIFGVGITISFLSLIILLMFFSLL